MVALQLKTEQMKITIQPTFGKKTSFRIHVKPHFTVKTTKIKICRKRGIREVIHLSKEDVELCRKDTVMIGSMEVVGKFLRK